MREIAPPTAEPISLDEARVHLRQKADGVAASVVDDDSWVEAKITAVRQSAEQFLGFPLSDATYVQAYDSFTTSAQPSIASWWGSTTTEASEPYITLPRASGEVVAVQYLDASNVLQTLDPAKWEFDDFGGVVHVAAPPAISTRASAVRVQFKGAYHPADAGASPPVLAAPVPEDIKHAMLLMLGHFYENRESVVVGASVEELPMAVEHLLRPHRDRLGMA